ncbi:MAG: RDD family protein [Dehalococcoidia bacterium]|nr:RDD family protein [Dehalococcoidia bacterium]
MKRLFAFSADVMFLTGLGTMSHYLVGGDMQQAADLVADAGFVAYRVAGNCSGGTLSLGKSLFGLRVLDLDTRRRPSVRGSLLRELPLLLGLPPGWYLAARDEPPRTDAIVVAVLVLLLAAVWLVADIVAALRDSQGRSLHDRLAGTVVVDARQAGPVVATIPEAPR